MNSNDTPRGIRNNNPGNVRLGTAWEGLVDQINGVADPAFCQFIDAEHGIRAINHILNSYAARGVVALHDIISTWAPASENDTEAYIAAVASSMGVAPTATITPDLRAQLIAAITMHENGQQPYDMATIEAAMVLA